MSRRQRSEREKALRSRVARAKALRRRARAVQARRAATAAAAAVTLAGTGTAAAAPSAAVTTTEVARASLAHCDGATTPGSSPGGLTDVDGTLFFTAFDTRGNALWRSDGTATGTVRLKHLGSGGDGYYEYHYDGSSMVAVNGALFFTVEAEDGDELWQSDGTRAGTVLVKRFPAEDGGYDEDGGLAGLTAVGDTLFFTADDGVHGEELWKSDGTAGGTALVKDVGSGDGGYYSYGPTNLTAVGDTLFFTADDGTHGDELWRSDGTEAGTVLVKDIRPGSYSSSSGQLVGVGDVLFFRARDGVHGRELWSSDGTEAGTALVKDINPGAQSSNPEEMVGLGDTLFFAADDGTHGRDLWSSDGTEAGTALVKDLASDGNDDEYYGVSELEPVGDTLFFAADDGSHGQELWSSDGTEAGTVLVKDIRAGDYDSYPSQLTEAGGALFFTARDGVHGRELWTSDGTEAGTSLVEDINPDSTGRSPSSLVESDGELFFAADDRVHGEEVWRSNGTEAGTVLVEDINTGGAFVVASRGDANTTTGTLRVRVVVDGAGTLAVAPAGKRWIKRAMREVSGSGEIRTSMTLEPTRAAKRELRRNGELRVRARFTFTSCGGNVSSVTRRYTLRMR